MKYFKKQDLMWMPPLALGLGAVLSLIQPGNWFFGWLESSLLFLLCFLLLTVSARWANGASTVPDTSKTLAWMLAVAFALRFFGGVATYLALPVDGFADEDDKAGYVYTDAHRRDGQAWELAGSEHPILDAFNKKFAYDQYGGLLAISAFVYRYISPDAHRPLLLVLLASFAGTLCLSFLWKAVTLQWGQKVAVAAGWVFALYPEGVLLGGSSMREPYLMLFSAFTLWGFVIWQKTQDKKTLIWFGLGILGMLLVSPVVALVTLALFAGWVYFTREHSQLSWWGALAISVVFIAGLFWLASTLDRQGNLGGGTPLAVINNFLREAIKMDLHHLERGSGWVQKLFDEMPKWLRLPFVLVYGVFQPVLPAAFVEPTTFTWRVIAIARAVGWYALLPALILSFGAAAGQQSDEKRKLLVWLSLVAWFWVLLTSLRGGADQWDNPRYRTIMFLWQAILAGHVWVWWRESRNAWFLRVVAMEVVFLLVFGQWYASRYFHLGGQMQFAQMVAVILGGWVLILLGGWWQDRKKGNP
ncbi:MAG TPA: hypothetical protein PLM13_15265 [Anaerolineales bacterium]|nr:hypothetical protein [Anaerolineales bacterium]